MEWPPGSPFERLLFLGAENGDPGGLPRRAARPYSTHPRVRSIAFFHCA
jgi:hypothetical protein